MERNVTARICCAAVAAALMIPAALDAQSVRKDAQRSDTAIAWWVPAVASDGTIQWGAAGDVTQQPMQLERRSVPNIFQVVAVERFGGFVVLEDGTRWEVFLPHRPGTAMWQPGDHVLIQLLPVRRGAHTYRLQNGERDDVAAVRFAGMGAAPPVPGIPPTPPAP